VKVPNDIPAAYASTLTINPATAYCLLREFETLKPGDVIIQNGANSMVGLAVIQMARDMGVKTINVVRQHRYVCLY
jgi:trans-2-enoyl-CoA reductase